jgi:hypothetical protein
MVSGPDGVVYLIGSAQTPDFPFTLNASALPQSPLGSYTAGSYVLAVNPAFTGLQYSTFLGGLDPYGVAIDLANHLHIVGLDITSPFPLANAVDVDISQGGYALELDPTSAPVVLTRFGGHVTQQIPSAVAVDADLNVYLSGPESNSGFLIFPDPVMIGPSLTQNLDTSGTFLAKISPSSAPQIGLNNLAPYLTLRNVGTAPLHISSITFGGSLAKQWGTCGITLPGGTSCSLTVTDANGNRASGSVTINSDASPSSQTFALTLAPGQIPDTPVQDLLTFQDVPFNFPLQLEGTSTAPIALTVSNAGTVNSVIDSITASGNATQTNNCGTVIPGGSCTIMVSVTPGANNYSGDLTIGWDSGLFQQSYTFYSQFSTQALVLSTTGISFATQQINGVAIPRVVNLTNTSNVTLPVPTFSLQGDPVFTITGNNCAAPIPAHQSCAVAVKMNSGMAGMYNGTLMVTASGGGGNVTLYGQTQNNTLVQTSPAGLNFGATAVGGSQTLPLMLTNSGNSPYAVTGIQSSLGDYSETDNCQGQIAVGGTCTVSVQFSPKKLGFSRGALTIGVSISSVAQNVTVAGNGVLPLQVSPTSLDFGSTVYVGGTSAAQMVNLTNQVASAQKYTVSISGDFVISNSCANPLPSATTCGLSVTFQPKSAGAQQGTLTVSYPGTTLTSVVNLTAATGQPFTFQPAAGQTLNAMVEPGATASFQLQAVAASGFNGTVQLGCSGAPTYATCTIQPMPVVLASGAGSGFMVTVTTTQTAGGVGSLWIYVLFGAALVFGSMAMALSLPPAKPRGARVQLGLSYVGVPLLIVFAIAGCGGGSGYGTGPAQHNTPPGTYTIVVTGTSGAASQAVNLTLIVE